MRYWISLLAGCCLIAVLASPAGASAASRNRCAHKGAKVFAKGPGWIAWKRMKYDDAQYVACRTATGRKITLGEEYEGGQSSQDVELDVAGNQIAVSRVEWHYTDVWTEVKVFDLKRGKLSRAWAGVYGCDSAVTRPVVTRDGAAAFIASGRCRYAGPDLMRVIRLVPAGSDAVAEGTAIDKASLRVSGRTISWNDAGVTRSASLDSAPVSDPCRPAGSYPLALTSAVRVFTLGSPITGYGNHASACRAGAAPQELAGYTANTALATAGDQVAWIATTSHEKTEPHSLALNVLDTRTGVASTRWTSEPIPSGYCTSSRVTELVVDETGTTAHAFPTGCRSSATSAIWVSRDGDARNVAEANRLLSGTLAIQDDTVTWTERGGAVRSAPID